MGKPSQAAAASAAAAKSTSFAHITSSPRTTLPPKLPARYITSSPSPGVNEMLVGRSSPGMTRFWLAIVTRSVPSSAIASVGRSIVCVNPVEKV